MNTDDVRSIIESIRIAQIQLTKVCSMLLVELNEYDLAADTAVLLSAAQDLIGKIKQSLG